MIKASELREMSDEQLAVTLRETTEGLFRLRLQAQTERLDAPSELRKHRQLIARIKTVQHERARAQTDEQETPQGEAPSMG
jgi:large subunit ribosomal protein L29